MLIATELGKRNLNVVDKMRNYNLRKLGLHQVADSSVSTSGGHVKDPIPSVGKRKETSTQRKRRLEKARKKYRAKRMNETEEARRIRLQKRRQRYQNETEEQRTARLELQRIRQMQARAGETQEKAKVRQEKDRIRQSRFRAKETFEKRQIRLEKQRIRFHRLKALRNGLIVQELDVEKQ